MQEGNKIKFETNGIVRSTSDNVTPDGGCNEIIGLIYDNGSLVPYNPIDLGISCQYDKLWVHKTTKQENYIGLTAASQTTGQRSIYWIEKEAFLAGGTGWVKIADLPIGVKKIDFVGNLIAYSRTIHLFKNGLYSSAFNLSDLDIKMDIAAQGNGVAVMYDSIDFSNDTAYSTWGKYLKNTFETDGAYERINNDFKVLEQEVRRGEYISGACYLRYAIKLYDGSYVNFSKPVLVKPDTKYTDVKGEKLTSNEPITYHYSSNPLKMSLTDSLLQSAKYIRGLKSEPQIGLIQSFFGSTAYWAYVNILNNGNYIDTLQRNATLINGALTTDGIYDDYGEQRNIGVMYLGSGSSGAYGDKNLFQPLNLDYWLLTKGKVGFREAIQFNNTLFEKDKYYKLNRSSSILKYFDLLQDDYSYQHYNLVRGWTWGVIPYFVPVVYTGDEQGYDDCNMLCLLGATASPLHIGQDGLYDNDDLSMFKWFRAYGSDHDKSLFTLAPLATADGLDSSESWFTTRLDDNDAANDAMCRFGMNPYKDHIHLSGGSVGGKYRGAIFEPLNEHIGELGFGVVNHYHFEKKTGALSNNVTFAFGRELYTPVYRLLTTIPSAYEDLIQSVDIFMTQPVSMHEDYKVENVSFDSMPAHRPYRTDADVEKDLKDGLKSFYKIHSIPIEELLATPAQTTIMPYIERGKISNLEQQESLQITNDSQYDYKVSYVYNDKLHIAQITEVYKESVFQDCNSEIARKNDARGHIEDEPYDLITQSQISLDDRLNGISGTVTGVLHNESEYDSDLMTALARTGVTLSSFTYVDLYSLVDVKIDDNYVQIVKKDRFNLNQKYPLSKCIFYPNANARSVTLLGFEIQDIGTGNKYFYEIPNKQYTLEQDKTTNLSYYIDVNEVFDWMTPSNIATYNVITNINHFPYKPFEKNNEFVRDRNIFKVSEENQPLVFPLENTYKVGFGKIIAFSSYSTALSQGQFGEYPLLVFTTEGIFAMRVDTSGIGSYLSNAPLSREVCINTNTIVQVDGGVFFASKKGLMFLSGENAVQYSAMVNGEPCNKPVSSAVVGDGLSVYRNAVNNAQLVRLVDSISTEDFRDYLSLADTCISYLYRLHKLLVYNKTKMYSYLVDIDDNGNATKLSKPFAYSDDNYPDELIMGSAPLNPYLGTLHDFTAKGDDEPVEVLMQTRPIKIDSNEFKSSYRTVLRGLFVPHRRNLDGGNPQYMGIYILGSIDGLRWMFMGGSEINTGSGTAVALRDVGTTIERTSVKYLMAIYVGRLKAWETDNGNVVSTKIDNLEISTIEKYNDKTR